MANINIPSGPNNLRNSLVDMLVSKNMDMKMRRVVDASPAQDPNDYVILQQLTDTQTALQKGIDDNTAKIKSLTQAEADIIQNLLLYVQANNSLTLTTTPQNIPGLTLTLSTTGVWLIIVTVGWQQGGAGDTNFTFIAQINIDGAGVGPQTFFFTPGGVGVTITQSGAATATQYLYNATTQPHTVTVQAYKTGGTGTSATLIQSTLSALWVRG